jgi:hypothetical protein
MEPLIVNSDPSLQDAFGRLREDYAQHRYLCVTWKTGKHRSLPQNDQDHVWYEQLARELREDDKRGWTRFCKLHFGVPIMRSEDADYRAAYDATIRTLSYDQKLIAMDHWPVTRLMTKKQIKQYQTDMQDFFRTRHGVELKYQPKSEDARPAR